MNQILNPHEIAAKINELNDKIEIRRSACQQIHNKLKETKITSGELANNMNYLISYDMNCSLCDTPGNYLQHIWGCLESKEEIENWKNDVLHFIQQRKEVLIREGKTITEQEFQAWEVKASEFAKSWEEWYLKKIEEEKKVFALSVSEYRKCSQCNNILPIINGNFHSYALENKKGNFCSPGCIIECYGQGAISTPTFSSGLGLCSLCKNNPARVKNMGQDKWYCSLECADQEYYKCEECNKSSIHYVDGKKSSYCLIDGKKLCFSCFEIRAKGKYNSPSTNNEQETPLNFSDSGYSAGNYYSSPKVEFDHQHDQHQEKEPQTTQQRSPSISNSELDLHKKITQKEIEKLLENNPQIKLEENWKEKLDQLNDFYSINEFVEQTKSTILAKVQEKKQEQINSEKPALSSQENIKETNQIQAPLITSIAIIGSVIFVASLIFIRKNKLKAK